MRKRNALIAVFVLALGLTWPVYSLIRQAHRDAAYRTAIAPFQRDLHVGMAEEEVKRYLDWRHVEYHPVRLGGSNGPTYQIGVGEEDSLIFDRDGSIALEFGNAGGAKRGSRKADSSLP